METKTETTIENTIKSRIESIKNIDVNLFYSVGITDTRVTLQGDLTKKNRSYCEGLGFKFELTENTWIQAENDGIRIVLTFN